MTYLRTRGKFLMGVVDKFGYFVGLLHSEELYDIRAAKAEILNKARKLNLRPVGVVFRG